jgi:hypothetical protein
MNVEWREHLGRKYLYVDYGGCRTEDEMLAIYEEQAHEMKARSEKSRVLANFNGCSWGSRFMQRVRTGGAEKGKTYLERTAMVGVTGLKGILLDGYLAATGLGDLARTFDDEDEAISWLVG